MTKIITRFAPSPTGYLHIGSARTALFNYLYAKHHQGKFLLRIEDTDKQRSTDESLETILSGLKWLGIDWDDQIIFQSNREKIYQNAAQELLNSGKAYYCFESQKTINQQREEATNNKQSFIFRSPWREESAENYPKDIKPVVRLKAPREGVTIIQDQVQGEVIVQNDHLDDMVLLRSDGSPTYMLAVVVDDHEMGITHIIRGDDHLSNASRQMLIYQAFGWTVPVMVHIPLIHEASGTKLSKRRGALGVESYKDLGILPDALFNYLLRLGWSHQNDEIISKTQAIDWFTLEGLGKSAAKLDFAKIKNLNAHYLRLMDNDKLSKMVINSLSENYSITEEEKEFINCGIDSLKLRSELIGDLVNLAKIFLVNFALDFTDEATEIINHCNKILIKKTADELLAFQDNFTKDDVNVWLKQIAVAENMSLGELMKPIRALITGMVSSPSVFEIIAIIGKQNAYNRLTKYFNNV